MSEAIPILDAVAMDATHLELSEPLPQSLGKNFRIAILAANRNHEHVLEKLKHAYLNMTKAEQAFEVKLAEEGVVTAPVLEIATGEAEKWWE